MNTPSTTPRHNRKWIRFAHQCEWYSGHPHWTEVCERITSGGIVIR